MSEELKPCPFCGREKPSIYQSGGYWKVKCVDGCSLSISGYAQKQGALTAWNRRPGTEDALTAEVEWLKSRLDKAVLLLIDPRLEAVKAENARLREVLDFHLRTHENFPAHGSARHMAMLEQLHQNKTNGEPIDRDVLPQCDCDTCVKCRAALEPQS